MFILIQIILNAIALPLTVYLLPGDDLLTGSWWYLTLAGLLLGIINYFLKPILKAIWPSLLLLNLLIFTILINFSLLVLVALLIPGVAIAGFWSAFWSILIISLVNYTVHTTINYHH